LKFEIASKRKGRLLLDVKIGLQKRKERKRRKRDKERIKRERNR
jgi:hypothetical protein